MKTFLKFTIALLLIFSISYAIMAQDQGLAKICFEKTCIKAEMAITSEKKSQGLMYRESMPSDHGMIFIWEKDAPRSFWMKNTLIPLDMIFVDEDFIVQAIEHAVPCKTETCVSYRPEKPAKYVIEVNGGFTQKHSINVGDKVDIKVPKDTQ